MKSGLHAFIAIFLGVASGVPASGQTSPTPNKQAGDAGSTSTQDVVVIGTPDGPFPVKVDAQSLPDLDVADLQAMEDARFFSKCVKPFDNQSVREAIDGPPNREMRFAALRRIIGGYQACYRGFNPTLGTTFDYGECNPRLTTNPFVVICQSFYDRGALVEATIKRYAPDLNFTRQELDAPAVVARLKSRESAFDRTRSKGDRLYAKVVTCFVGYHPQLALTYLRSDFPGDAERRARDALIGTSPQCVGGAKKVIVDPPQFRVYMADAVYSWAVAYLDVPSLIPGTHG